MLQSPKSLPKSPSFGGNQARFQGRKDGCTAFKILSDFDDTLTPSGKRFYKGKRAKVVELAHDNYAGTDRSEEHGRYYDGLPALLRYDAKPFFGYHLSSALIFNRWSMWCDIEDAKFNFFIRRTGKGPPPLFVVGSSFAGRGSRWPVPVVIGSN